MIGALIGSVLGSVAAVWALVWLVGILLFRNKEFPKRQLSSLPLAWAIASFVAGFGFAEGGAPRFDIAGLEYGIGAVLLGIYYTSSYFAYCNKTGLKGDTSDDKESGQ